MRIASLFCFGALLALILSGTGCRTYGNPKEPHYLYATRLGTNSFSGTNISNIDSALSTFKPKNRFETNENPTIIAYNVEGFSEIRLLNVQTHETVSCPNVVFRKDALTIVSLYVPKAGEYELFAPDWFSRHAVFRFSVARPALSDQPGQENTLDHSSRMGRLRELEMDSKNPWQNYDVIYEVMVEQKWYELLDQGHYGYQTGKVVLKSRLFPDGTIDEVKTVESDISRPQTESCIEALLKTSPFQPWPKSLQFDYREITFTFNCL